MMKHVSSIILITLLLPVSTFAQDIIYMMDGSEVEAKLMEISSSEIKYKRFDNLEGPLFVLERQKVFKVKYMNGQSEVMTKPGEVTSQSAASSSNMNSSTAPAMQSDGFNAVAFQNDGNYYLNQPYVVDRSSGQIVELERGEPEIKTSSVAAPFYASSSSSWMMEGESSPVRLKSSGGFNFVVKIAPGMDPRDILKLVRFDLMKRSRRDPARDRHMPSIKTTGSWGGASSEQVTENDVEISTKRLADGVYEIIPTGGIASGEYAFYIMHKFYAFGID